MYLSESLKSITKSHFSDFEIILLDDHSSDGSELLARELAAADNRIKVYSNDQNLGQFKNRAKAATLAKGKYLKYIDSDDIIYPHSLGVMVEALESNPTAALALSHSLPEDESPYPWLLTPEKSYQKEFLGKGCLTCGPSGAIIRRDAFEEIGGYNESWGVISDVELWYRIAAKWPTVLLPPGLVWWRRHEGQAISATGADLVYLRRGYELATNMLTSIHCPLTDSDSAEALRKCQQHFSRRIWSLALRQRRMSAALKIFRNSDLGFRDMLRGLAPYL